MYIIHTIQDFRLNREIDKNYFENIKNVHTESNQRRTCSPKNNLIGTTYHIPTLQIYNVCSANGKVAIVMRQYGQKRK